MSSMDKLIYRVTDWIVDVNDNAIRELGHTIQEVSSSSLVASVPAWRPRHLPAGLGTCLVVSVPAWWPRYLPGGLGTCLVASVPAWRPRYLSGGLGTCLEASVPAWWPRYLPGMIFPMSVFLSRFWCTLQQVLLVSITPRVGMWLQGRS